jgi:hypothetical protein
MHLPISQNELRKIAGKHNISLATANEIVRSQWEFLKKIMASCDADKDYFPMMQILHLGKFIVTNRMRWVVKNKRKK